MAGKHVIFACELGNGLRQADRILPIAAGLVAAGHRVSVVMPEGAPAASLIAAAGHPVLTGPSWRAEPPPGFLARAAEYEEASTIPRLLYLRTTKFDRG